MALRERLDGFVTRRLWAPELSPLYMPLLGLLAFASYPYRWGAAWDRRSQTRRRRKLPVPAAQTLFMSKSRGWVFAM